MPEEFEKTFIPRKRIDPGQAGLRIQTTVDTFTAVGILVFATVFFIALSIFGARIYLSSDIMKLETEAVVRAQSLNQSDVESLVALDKQVGYVSDILKKHISISSVFDFLENTTVVNASIGQLSFTGEKNGGVVLALSGSAESYNSLANQARAYNDSKSVKSAKFTGMTPNLEGEIDFGVEIAIETDAFRFSQK